MSSELPETINVDRSLLKSVSIDALAQGLNLQAASAEEIIRQFEYAELSGKKTHGFVRVPWLMSQNIGSEEPLAIDNESGPITRIDGSNAIGYLALNQVTEFVSNRAAQDGAHIAVIHNVFPTNTLGYYMRNLIANDGATGMLLGSTPKLAAAPHGRDRVVGTNPIAVGVHDRNAMLIADVTTARSSFGELLAAKYWGDIQLDNYNTAEGDTPKSIADLFKEAMFTGSIAQNIEQKSDRKLYALSLALQAMLSTLVERRGGRGDMVVMAIDAGASDDMNDGGELISGIDNNDLPGAIGHNRYLHASQDPTITIPKKLWEDIRSVNSR